MAARTRKAGDFARAVDVRHPGQSPRLLKIEKSNLYCLDEAMG